MRFLTNNGSLPVIKRLVRNKQQLRIAVAYWGYKSIQETGLNSRLRKNPSNVSVICDLLSGACNPEPIKKLRDAGVQIRTCHKMHAKVWISGNEVLLGSANVSANGLGFGNQDDRTGNIEASIHLTDENFSQQVQKWFDQLWVESVDVTDSHLASAGNLWKQRRDSPLNRRAPEKSLLQQIMAEGSSKKFSNVRLVVWQEGAYDWTKRDLVKIKEITSEAYTNDEKEKR